MYIDKTLTPKSLAAAIAMSLIKNCVETEEYIKYSELFKFNEIVVKQKLVALYNDISKENKLKLKLDET